MRFGCKPASQEKKAKVLQFKNYHLAALPPAPPGPLNYTTKSSGLSNIFLNDRLSCCVISAYYHIKCANTSLTGTEFIANDNQIISDYGFIGGYDGTPASDQGCDIPTALDWYLKTGDQIGTKILGYLAIDATNLALCRQLIYLFGNLYGGIGLPDDWVGKDMPNSDGFVWDVDGPANWKNGHCIPFLDYDQIGLNTDTWALKGTVTDKAIAEYFGPQSNGELYIIVTPDWLNKAQNAAPNSIAWSALIADFDVIGGSIPPPTPPLDEQVIWDVTTSVVTLPTGVTALASNLSVGVFFPNLNIVLLPSGWTASSARASKQFESFDITTSIPFITANLPNILQLLQLLQSFAGKK